MAIERFEIETEQWAVVPRDLMRRIEDYLSTERVSAGERLYNDVLGAMRAAPRPEAVKQSAPVSDAELVDIIYRAGLGHTSDLLYEKSKDGIEVDYPTVEARKLAAFLMRQPYRTPKTAPRPVPTSEFEPNKGCKTPGHCRTAGFCADVWACSSARPDAVNH